MAEYNTSDTLVDTALRVDDLLSNISDHLAATLGVGDEAHVWELIDATHLVLWQALAAHVDGVAPEWPQPPSAALAANYRYHDGSPVAEMIPLTSGAVATYYPRYDGDREAFINMFEERRRGRLTLVEGGFNVTDH